jgi:uncharacterized membrane protein
MDRILTLIRVVFDGLHPIGVALGSLFIAASLTPSLLPRPTVIQGLLSGIALAGGYGIGVLSVLIWNYLHLPVLPESKRRILLRAALLICGVLILVSLWRAAQWQNSIRVLMGMEPLTSAQPLTLGAIALTIFGVTLILARLFLRLKLAIAVKLQRFPKPRASKLVGFGISLWIYWMIANGFLIRLTMRTIDRSFQQLDAMIDDQLPVPSEATLTGSTESLIAWADLGNQGRRFVSTGPSASELKDFFGEECPAPIRVYVGLNCAETVELRAQMALDELIRVGGFERSLLIIATPTGTGWVDPGSQDTVEFLHRGDVATVSVQYSYLNSPLTLLTNAEYGAKMAEELFEKIYGHWRTLPKENRPRFFLSGLSLGSLNSDRSFQLFDIIDDPIDGALWIGPPFMHKTWRQATDYREVSSPAWLPRFRQGNVVRFMNQQSDFATNPQGWGSFRIGFLQHASDPIVFFEPGAAWREPSWMKHPRGPDVSPELRWFPVVTMLQLAADMIVGTAPAGFGHNYSANEYLTAWFGLTEPQGWSVEELERLQNYFCPSTSERTSAP